MRVDLGARRVGRDEHGQRQIERARGMGQRPAVVAGGRRHESRRISRAGTLANAQRRVERAADLVRAGGLDDFELEVDSGAGGVRQPVRAAHRRAQHATLDPRGGLTNVGERDGH